MDGKNLIQFDEQQYHSIFVFSKSEVKGNNGGNKMQRKNFKPLLTKMGILIPILGSH
jgi:hypothetical protein